MMNIFTFIFGIFTKLFKTAAVFSLGCVLFSFPGCASGPRNVSTVERVPPDQTVIDGFPNLYYDEIPDLNRETWTLKLTGAINDTVIIDWNRLIAMDTVTVVSDFHCVTGWSRLDNRWTGVRLRDIIGLAVLGDSANYINFVAADSYQTFLPVRECLGDDDLLAFRWEGQDLTTDTGGPVRVVIPGKYGYKNAKWLIEMRFSSRPEEGTWESQGYSNTADPWKNDRVQSKSDTTMPHRFK